MKSSLIVLVLLSCFDNEYHFYPVGDGADPDTGGQCFDQSSSHRFDLNEDGNWDTCSTYGSEITIYDLTGTHITGGFVYSNAWDVDVPESWEPINIWTLVVPDLAGWWKSYPGDEDKSADENAIAWDMGDGWYAQFDEDDVDHFDDCYPNCSYYTFGTEIHDALSAQSYGDGCQYYDNTEGRGGAELEVCMSYDYTSGSAEARMNTTCQAGSGRFELVPYKAHDANGDGTYSVFWKPVMDTSSGRRTPVLTGAATITKIQPVDTHGKTLKVVKSGKTFSFGPDDSLVAARGSTTTLSHTRASRFTHAELDGEPAFVSEGNVDGDEVLEVDMTWTCPLASSDTPPPIQQGYTFMLEDIGCPIGRKQKVTYRPFFGPDANSFSYLQVELYGMGTNNVKVPLTYDTGRWYFNYEGSGLTVMGSINEDDASDVTFDVIESEGESVCTTGSYTFGKEK